MEAPAQGGLSLQAEAMTQAANMGPGTWNPPPSQPPLPLSEQGCRERLMELPASFKELLTFFCTNATIHGTIRLVCYSPNRLKKASWGLLLLGTLGILYWQLGLLLEQYWRYPTIMSVSVHSERKFFPSVTLCDMNPRRPSPIHRHLEALDAFAQENIYSLYNFNLSEGRDAPFTSVPSPESPLQLDRRIRLQRLRHLGNQYKVGFRLCNSTGGDCFYRAYSSGVTAAWEWYRFHYMDILALLPTTWEDSHQSCGGRFILSCHYDRKDCQDRHFQKFHHPTYGSCYTFKGMWAAQRPGITHGISLVLRAKQQDHMPLLSTEAGIMVMVHGHNHTPFLEHLGFSIRPGTETTIGIREDEVHRLGSPYGCCTKRAESVEVPMLYNTSYTMQACLVSCFQKLMVETCSCGYYLYPLPVGAQYCNHKLHPAWGHCFYRLHQDLETHRLPCFSLCPRPCRESLYKFSAGTSRWPSTKSADWILAVLGKWGPQSQSWSRSQSGSRSRSQSGSWSRSQSGNQSRSQTKSRSQSPGHRSSVAKVNIFYQELNYQTADEAPVYSIPQLLSAMGSLWSLWFGSSVLSVLELLELLLDTMALALLLGFRRLCRAQVFQPGAITASGLSHPMPGASQGPRNCRHNGRGPGEPAGSHHPQMLPGALEEVSVEEIG